jgi:hypothetical protein
MGMGQGHQRSFFPILLRGRIFFIHLPWQEALSSCEASRSPIQVDKFLFEDPSLHPVPEKGKEAGPAKTVNGELLFLKTCFALINKK